MGFIAVALVGIFIIGYGIWEVVAPSGVTVEVIKGDQSIDERGEMRESGIFVDVAGEVVKPGVYQLPSGSRIGDALVMAGGLAANANREWVAKQLNLAKELKDQEKVYIPARNESGEVIGASINKSGKSININTASAGELDQLVGIGEVRAQAIVANRPYGSIDELMIKAKIPESVYAKIKDSISVY